MQGEMVTQSGELKPMGWDGKCSCMRWPDMGSQGLSRVRQISTWRGSRYRESEPKQSEKHVYTLGQFCAQGWGPSKVRRTITQGVPEPKWVRRPPHGGPGDVG